MTTAAAQIEQSQIYTPASAFHVGARQSPNKQNKGIRGTEGSNIQGSTKNMSLPGPSSEVDVLLKDVPCRALIDTGSMITTISKSLVVL